MAHTVGIVGASGYGGAELLRLLEPHPAVEVAAVAAHTQAGAEVAEVFPNVPADRRFDPVDVDRLGELELVFLSAPHAVALELAPALVGAGSRVVDLSGAFRLPAVDFEAWYGQPHPAPGLTPAVYGLTEYAREAVGTADFVANPGCYVTATLLGLLPLAGLLAPGSVVVDGKSGTSGAGRGTSDALHFSHVHGAVAAYGAPGHRHTREIEVHLDGLGGIAAGAVSFTPHLVPMSRGLLTTSYATLVDGAGLDDVTSALTARYQSERFVQVLPAGSFPQTKAVAGSNGCHIGVHVDERTGRVVVTTAIDNLGKGAAGQALQNANLMLGLDEHLGLTSVGVYP